MTSNIVERWLSDVAPVGFPGGEPGPNDGKYRVVETTVNPLTGRPIEKRDDAEEN